MKSQKKQTVNYFGCGSNIDHDMMAHMIGRENIHSEPATVIGYELCIIKTKHFRNHVPKTSPIKISPRALMKKVWGPDWHMYSIRPNPESLIKGVIWSITPKEFELTREWELVDYGAQEDIYCFALNSKKELVKVVFQGLVNPPVDKVHKVVTRDNYKPYIASKKAMLKAADFVRLEYLKSKKSNSNKK